jgi:hypothetical protein
MKRLMLTLLPLPISMMMLFQCSVPPVAGNPGGSEITNGKVVAMTGDPVSGVRVNAYPATYIQDRSSALAIVSAVTGPDGSFELEIDSGLYNLFIIDSTIRNGAFLPTVGPKTDLGTVTLDTLGSIAGTVHRADTSKANVSLIVYSKGTPLRTDVDGNDSTFHFGNIPSGKYTLSIVKYPVVGCIPGQDCNPGGGENPGNDERVVLAGMTTVVDTVINIANIGVLP